MPLGTHRVPQSLRVPQRPARLRRAGRGQYGHALATCRHAATAPTQHPAAQLRRERGGQRIGDMPPRGRVASPEPGRQPGTRAPARKPTVGSASVRRCAGYTAPAGPAVRLSLRRHEPTRLRRQAMIPAARMKVRADSGNAAGVERHRSSLAEDVDPGRRKTSTLVGGRRRFWSAASPARDFAMPRAAAAVLKPCPRPRPGSGRNKAQ